MMWYYYVSSTFIDLMFTWNENPKNKWANPKTCLDSLEEDLNSINLTCGDEQWYLHMTKISWMCNNDLNNNTFKTIINDGSFWRCLTTFQTFYKWQMVMGHGI